MAVGRNRWPCRGKGRWTAMISFLEMVQQYPIGAKINLPGEGRETGTLQEIVGYEYYNGTGYLVFGNAEKLNVDQLAGERRPKLY